MFFFCSFVLIAIVAALYGWADMRSRGTPAMHLIHREPSAHRKSDVLSDQLPLRAKTCFVTGAAGFLATNLVEELLNEGWQVTGLIRASSDRTALDKIADAHTEGQLKLVIGDITDYGSLQAVVPENIAVMFHVAATTTMWFRAYQQSYQVNVLGTRNVVNISLEKNVQKLVHTSSVSVYSGPGKSGPDRESLPHFALGSSSPYAYTKALAEEEVKGGIEDGLWSTILNPGAIIGKYDINGYARVGRMLKRGELPGVMPSTLSFGSVHEIAKAHIRAAEKGRLGRNYNLCGQMASLQQTVKWVGECIGEDGDKPVIPATLLRVLGLFNDLKSLWTNKAPDLSYETATEISLRSSGCDSSRAVAELDYNIDINLKELLCESMQWLQDTNRL